MAGVKATAAESKGATVALPAGLFKASGPSKGGKVRFYGVAECGCGATVYGCGDHAKESVAAAVAFSGRAVKVAKVTDPATAEVPTV